jgi:hypothetical protein
MFGDLFSGMGPIMIGVLAVAILLVLFFVGDIYFKGGAARKESAAAKKRPKGEPAPEEDAFFDQNEVKRLSAMEENRIEELNSTNLANDLHGMIRQQEEKEKTESGGQQQYFRSRLDSEKIREQFRARHRYYEMKGGSISNISDVSDIYESDTDSQPTLSAEDMRKFQMYQDILTRKGTDDSE